jgi:hypothetical protein
MYNIRLLLGREVCLSDLLSFQYQEIPDAPFLYSVSVSHVMAALSFRNDTKVVPMAELCTFVKAKILRCVVMKTTVFLDITPCFVLGRYQHFGGI